jgi:hypothetical protein
VAVLRNGTRELCWTLCSRPLEPTWTTAGNGRDEESRRLWAVAKDGGAKCTQLVCRAAVVRMDDGGGSLGGSEVQRFKGSRVHRSAYVMT